jgi:hypothetical protein
MEDQPSKYKGLHKKAWDIILIFKIFSSVMQDAYSNCPVHNSAKCPECVNSACGVGLRTVQHTVNEAQSFLYTRICKNVESLAKSQQQLRNKTGMDDFDRNILLCDVFALRINSRKAQNSYKISWLQQKDQ